MGKDNHIHSNEIFEKERNRLENIIDASNIGIWEWEIKTGNLVLNEKWAEMAGYTLKELAPISIDTWEKLSHPNDLKKSKEMIELVFNKSIPYYEVEVRVKHKNGNWIWVLDRGRVTSWNSDGSPLLMLGSRTNISKLKDVSSELRYEKELAQQYLNLAGTIILVLDTKGNITLINKKGCSIIGMDEKDIIGKNWVDNFIPKENVDEIKEVFKSVFSAKSELADNHENTIITSDNKERIIAWDNNILYNPNGEISGVISSGEDVTEIRRKEDELIHVSYHDSLTGLCNRRFFKEQLKRLDNPRNLPLSIIIGDVNGLKLTNDAFGHKAGDELLKVIGDTISTSIRGNDIATRWGGDEFAILLPNSGTYAAEMLVKRIHKKIKKFSFKYGIISISFGVGTKKDNEEDMEKVFTSAEESMYQNKLVDINNISVEAINAIMNTLFEKSGTEKDHSTRVSELSVSIAKEMGLSKTKINDIKTMGLIHDIGKIVIDLNILDKPGELTDKEREIIKQHPLSGSRLLNNLYKYARLAAGVLHHHERIDGKGYPNGIAGDQIPIESKIIAVTDSFDSMTSKRPYRLTPLSLKEAIAELQKHSGTQFDKTVVDVFVNKVLK